MYTATRGFLLWDLDPKNTIRSTLRGVMGSVFTVVIGAVVLTGAATTASADWRIAGYVGAAHTSSTTLRVSPAAGTPVAIPDVEFRGESWTSPIYYGYRIGWQRERSAIGFEAEFTHAKTIAADTHSTSLTRFEQSHGLNVVLANVSYRSQAFCGGRCVAVGRVGGGVSIPHVEATYLGDRVSSYQFGGPAVQAGAGLEFAVYGNVTLDVDGRITYTRVTDDLDGATLSAPFATWHVTVGAGWRFRSS